MIFGPCIEHKEEVIAPKKSVPDGDRGNPEVTKQLDALGKISFVKIWLL